MYVMSCICLNDRETYEQFWKKVSREMKMSWRVETWLGELKEWLRVPAPLRVVIGESVMALNFITTGL